MRSAFSHALEELLREYVGASFVSRALGAGAESLGHTLPTLPAEFDGELLQAAIRRVRGLVDESDVATMMLRVAELYESHEALDAPRKDAVDLASMVRAPMDASSSSEIDVEVRVLVVDANEISRRVLKGMLHLLGIRPFVASSAAEALKLFDEVGFDAVLVDCTRDTALGLRAAKRIRDRGSSATQTGARIVAVTMQDGDEIRRQAKTQGVDALLVRPISRTTLAGALMG